MNGAFWKDYERQSRARRMASLAARARCIDCHGPVAPRQSSRAGQTRTPLRCPICATARMYEHNKASMQKRRLRC